MPIYTYRREDGTTFDYRQKFLDNPLTVDPETGQHVVRVIQAAGVIFKGSGFYVNDSKSASRSAITSPAHKSDGKSESKSESSATPESKSTSAGTESSAKTSSVPASASAAAD